MNQSTINEEVIHLLKSTYQSGSTIEVSLAQNKLKQFVKDSRFFLILNRMLEDVHIEHEIKLSIASFIVLLTKETQKQNTSLSVKSIFFLIQNIIYSKTIPQQYKVSLMNPYITLYKQMQRSFEGLFNKIYAFFQKPTTRIIGIHLFEAAMVQFKSQNLQIHEKKIIKDFSSFIYQQLQKQSSEIVPEEQEGGKNFTELWRFFDKIIKKVLKKISHIAHRSCFSNEIIEILQKIFQIKQRQTYIQAMEIGCQMIELIGRKGEKEKYSYVIELFQKQIENHAKIFENAVLSFNFQQITVSFSLLSITLIRNNLFQIPYLNSPVNFSYFIKNLAKTLYLLLINRIKTNEQPQIVHQTMQQIAFSHSLEQKYDCQLALSLLIRNFYERNDEWAFQIRQIFLSLLFHEKELCQNKELGLLLGCILVLSFMKNLTFSEKILNWLENQLQNLSVMSEKVSLLYLYMYWMYMEDMKIEIIELFNDQIYQWLFSHSRNQYQEKICIQIFKRENKIGKSSTNLMKIIKEINLNSISSLNLFVDMMDLLKFDEKFKGKQILNKLSEFPRTQTTENHLFFGTLLRLSSSEDEQIENYILKILSELSKEEKKQHRNEIIKLMMKMKMASKDLIQEDQTFLSDLLQFTNNVYEENETFYLLNHIIIYTNKKQLVFFVLNYCASYFSLEHENFEISTAKILLLVHSLIYYHHQFLDNFQLDLILQIFLNGKEKHSNTDQLKGKYYLIIVLLLRYDFERVCSIIMSKYSMTKLERIILEIYINEDKYKILYDITIFVTSTLSMLSQILRNKRQQKTQFSLLFIKNFAHYAVGGSITCLYRIYWKQFIYKRQYNYDPGENLKIAKPPSKVKHEEILQIFEEMTKPAFCLLNQFQIFKGFVRMLFQKQQTKKWLQDLLKVYLTEEVQIAFEILLRVEKTIHDDGKASYWKSLKINRLVLTNTDIAQ